MGIVSVPVSREFMEDLLHMQTDDHIVGVRFETGRYPTIIVEVETAELRPGVMLMHTPSIRTDYPEGWSIENERKFTWNWNFPKAA
jgi:hypothetical protein